MEPTPVSCSIILGIFGSYRKVEPLLAGTLKSVEDILNQTDNEVILVCDNSGWSLTPLIQEFLKRFGSQRVTIFFEEQRGIPAALFNKGISQAKGDTIYCIWPGCLPDVDLLRTATEQLLSIPDNQWQANIRQNVYERIGVPVEMMGNDFLAYFLSCTRFIHLCDVIFKRDVFQNGHRFNEDQINQKQFDILFYYELAVIKQKMRPILGHLVKPETKLEEFPFEEPIRVSDYITHAYRVRVGNNFDTEMGKHSSVILQDFLGDLPLLERAMFAALLKTPFKDDLLPSPFGRPIKVGVTGGVWEYHHNRLYFYNYFKFFEGKGLFSYVPLLDMIVDPERDLAGIDILIISRGRNPNVIKIIEYCQVHNIPTIYMIDDNWLAIAKDWPDPYAKIFVPGLESYEVFISAMKMCDITFVCSRILEEDFLPYARRIIRLPVNINRKDFERPLNHPELTAPIRSLMEWREKTGGVIIGYAGTVRYSSDAAFQALAEISHERGDKVRLFMFGFLMPEQDAMFNRENVTFLPFVPYEDYASALGTLKPDIMLAPLFPSRTNMSKIPTKYLDYALVEAAGVYSNMPPYTDYIQDRVNGLLVDNADQKAWKDACTLLIDDEGLRKSITTTAKQDVLDHYESSVIAPSFANMLSQAFEIRKRSVSNELPSL